MRKYLLIISVLIFFIFPSNVKAVVVRDTTITGVKEKQAVEEIPLTFGINFSGLGSEYSNTLGIWIVTFEVIYDENVLVATSIDSNGFYSELKTIDNKHYAISVVIDNSANTCVYGLLYCGNYSVTINFFIKNTDLTSTTVKMGDFEIALLDIVDLNRDYTLDDAISLEGTSNKTHTITIKPLISNIEVDVPKDITETDSSQITSKTTKSNNTRLKTLTVDDYDISFKKEQKLYTISIDESVNKLSVNAEVEDDKSSYVIEGADDLKANNYMVKIIVTAENGDESIYTIYTQIKKSEQKDTSSFNFSSLIGDFKVTKSILITSAFIGGGILLLIIIFFGVRKLKDRKLDKALDDFNKE